MFDKFRKTLKERRLNKEMLAFDKEKSDNAVYLYGKWQDGKRVYDNGCYFIPDTDKTLGLWFGKLYTKGGKEIGSYDMQNIMDWHSGFITVRYRYSGDEIYYDCDGNAIFDAAGVFISNSKEFGPDLYLIPVGEKCSKYVLYNHKTRKFVSDSGYDGHYITFDGVKPQGDVIIATVEDLSDVEGYGTLNDSTYYRMTYTINRSGKIIDTKKEITKTTHGE
jgi:hypothetical protein